MNDHGRPLSPEAEAIAAGKRSKADIAAGRVEDFNVVMTELRAYLDEKMKTPKVHSIVSQE